MPSSSFNPSRRTLVKGAAWSVPVIAVTGQVAAADVVCSPGDTSPECNPVTPPTSRPGEACKFSGGSCGGGWKHAYRFVFCMTNRGVEPITVNFTNLHVNGRNNTPSPTAVSVPADGREHCYYVLVNEQGNSANGQGTLYWNYTWTDEYGNDRYVEGSSPTGVNELPPCGDCSTTYDRAGAPMVQETQTQELDEAPASDDVPASESTTNEVPASEPTTTEQTTDEASTTAGPTG